MIDICKIYFYKSLLYVYLKLSETCVLYFYKILDIFHRLACISIDGLKEYLIEVVQAV